MKSTDRNSHDWEGLNDGISLTPYAEAENESARPADDGEMTFL